MIVDPRRGCYARAGIFMGKFFGSLLVALAVYTMVSAVALTLGVALLARGVVSNIGWLRDIESELYSTSRNIWQAQANCVVYDDQLIFKPKNGSCEFSNVEFKTILNFSDAGRSTGVKPKGEPIVVLGDSHAMGWGVNDEDTFAARLEKITGRPIYNLAVAGYGTAREVLRFEQSAVPGNVKTVIIQYCNNDRRENLAFAINSPAKGAAKFKIIQSKGVTNDLWARIKHYLRLYKFTFVWPFRRLGETLRGGARASEFGPHYQALMPVLKRSRALAGKRVIVFYSNAHGRRFRNFPSGQDKQLPNVYFIDLELNPDDYFRLDDHLNSAGHKKIALKLAELLKTLSGSDPS